MDRFHIVIFNYEHISSFLNNFHKIKNFNSVTDKIFIIDCSVNYKSQQKEVIQFCRNNGWVLGEQIQFIRRKNWGLAEGGRIDYFTSLSNSSNQPKYIWQFQEHYLDLESPWSINKEGTYDVDGKYIGGQIKGDVIPDELIIDLNVCEKIYETHPEVSVLYADRLKIGILPYKNIEFFYIDGANFSIRTSYAVQAFDQNLLENCKLIHDPRYKWAVFMEFKWGFQLTEKGCSFYDLVSNYCFNSPQSLRQIELRNNTMCLHQIAENYYEKTYDEYNKLYSLVANLNYSSKKIYQVSFILKTSPSRVKKNVKFILNKFGFLQSTKTL